MAKTRRDFLKTGSMFALFAGMPGVVAKVVQGSPNRARIMAADDPIVLTRSTFTPYVDTTFRVQTGSGTVNVTLASATDLKAGAPNPSLIAGVESFSLLFAGSSQSSPFGEGIYTIEHDALGTFSLFLSPVGKPANRHYEAVITRL